MPGPDKDGRAHACALEKPILGDLQLQPGDVAEVLTLGDPPDRAWIICMNGAFHAPYFDN